MNAADRNDTSAPPPPPPPPPPAPPRLTRATDDKVVAGLCGGLGRHFGVDPVVFRIAFVVTALAGGSGVLLYLVGWLLVPDAQSGATIVDRARHGHGSQVLAAVLLAGGALILLERLGDHGDGGMFGGLVLLGVGAAVLWSRRGSSSAPLPPAPPGSGPVPPPAAWAPPPPRPLALPPGPGEHVAGAAPTGELLPSEPPPGDVTTSDVTTANVTASDVATPDATTFEVPTSEVPISDSPSSASDPAGIATASLEPGHPISDPPPPGPPPGLPGSAAPSWPPQPPARAPRPRSALVAVTLSLLAILAGVLALLGVTDTADVPAVVGLALGVLVVGTALLVGAWRGRARWLIPVGMVLGVALCAASIIDVPIRGGIGDRTFRPRVTGELQSPYRLAAGDLVVDLSRVDLSGTTQRVTASVAAGQLEVVVPNGAEVVVDARVGAGSMTVFGRQTDGNERSRRLVEPGREGGGRLILSARTGFGELEVRRASS